MNPVTFEHITFQTGQSTKHQDFVPSPEAQASLSVLKGPGYYNLMGLKLYAARMAPGYWTFDIFLADGYVVRLYACFDAAHAATSWKDAFGECMLRQRGPVSAPLFVPAGLVFGLNPSGPFLMAEIQRGLADHFPAALLLGDLEKCLYWRYSQL